MPGLKAEAENIESHVSVAGGFGRSMSFMWDKFTCQQKERGFIRNISSAEFGSYISLSIKQNVVDSANFIFICAIKCQNTVFKLLDLNKITMSLQFSCNIIAGTESTQLPCQMHRKPCVQGKCF